MEHQQPLIVRKKRKMKNHRCSAQRHCESVSIVFYMLGLVILVSFFFSWDQQYETELENFREFGDIGA